MKPKLLRRSVVIQEVYSVKFNGNTYTCVFNNDQKTGLLYNYIFRDEDGNEVTDPCIDEEISAIFDGEDCSPGGKSNE